MTKHIAQSLTQRLHDKLQTLGPTHLEIINDSHKHQGHSSSPQTGESHFTIRIKSPILQDLPLIKAHQHIYALVDQELKDGIHALSIKIIK